MTADSLDVMFQTFYYAYAHSNFVFQTRPCICDLDCLPVWFLPLNNMSLSLFYIRMYSSAFPCDDCGSLAGVLAISHHDFRSHICRVLLAAPWPWLQGTWKSISVKVGFLPGLCVVWRSCPCSPIALRIMYACDGLEGSALVPFQIHCDKTRRGWWHKHSGSGD